MKAITKITATAVWVLLGTLMSSVTSHAEVGTVTVDGEEIPPTLFTTFALDHDNSLYHDDLPCPPGSDSYVRETVVMYWLLGREGKRKGVVFEGVDKRAVDDATQRLERLPLNAKEEKKQWARWRLLEQVGQSSRRALVGDIDEATILERYRQAIKEGHPELVNLTLLRRTDYTLENTEARDEVRRMIEAGRSIAELESENLLGSYDPYQSEEWQPVVQPDSLHTDQAVELVAGDIIYSEKYGKRSIVHIHETKILSRVRPYQPIEGDEWFARRVARHIVFKERSQELESSLRKQARVEEDSVLVEAPLNYPVCD